MTFRSFAAATRPELVLPATVHPTLLQESGVAATLDAPTFDVDAYDLAWQDYLTCGGFPRAVFEHVRLGAVGIPFLRDLGAWLRRDIDPDAQAESIALLLDLLAVRSTSPLNIRNAAAELGYQPASFSTRLNRLVSSFAAIWCPQRDDSGRPVRGSQPKLYLVDPGLAWLPSRLQAGCTAPEMTSLTESAVAVHLARSIDLIEEGRLVANDTIGYARTGSGNEVDLLPVPVTSPAGRAHTTPLEAKWVDDGWRSEARVIHAKYGNGILATKSILNTENSVWAVPAPLVALLLL